MRRKGLLAVLLSATLMTGVMAAPVHGKKVNRVPQWGGLDSPLRPGASLGGYCTYNWVFYSEGTKKKAPKAYIGTAGHCTDELGEIVTQPDLGQIGTVVYDSDLVESGVDFSLIEIKPEFVGDTNPQMLGWEGPKGSVDMENLGLGDRLDVFGYGLGVGMFEQTRPRYGFLTAWNDDEYQADMPAVNGDSGAPLLHHDTGMAFGIISRYGLTVPPSTDMGPVMPWIFRELDAAGFKIKLATI